MSFSRFCTALSLLAIAAPLDAHAINWRATSGLAERAAFQTVISNADLAGDTIDAWAIDAGGDWIVVADGVVSYSSGFDSTIVTATKLNLAFGRKIYGIDCNAAGACVMVHSKGYQASGTLPTGLGTKINSLLASGWVIRDVEITNSGYLLLYGTNNASYTGLDADLSRAIADRVRADRVLTDVSIGIDGRWAMLAGQNPMFEGISSSLETSLASIAQGESDVDELLLGPSGTYVAYNGDDDTISPDLTDPIRAIEYNLRAGGSSFNVWQRMSAYGIPGMSIAIVEGNEVVYARGYGKLDVDGDLPILGNTPFDIASLSKFPSAMTALATVEALNADGVSSNDLDLDEDIVDASVTKGTIQYWYAAGLMGAAGTWGFTVDTDPWPTGDVTMRGLLSHTASMRNKGSTPVLQTYASTDHETFDWLVGLTCETGPCDYSNEEYAWVDETFGEPGTDYNYSNSGYLAAQAMLEDYTGATGAELIEDTLIGPLGLTSTSAAYPSYDGLLARTAVQHDTVAGAQDRMLYPWTFAGGYLSSAEDYAQFLILALNGGKDGSGTRIVPASVISEVLTQQTGPSMSTSYGMGVLLPNGTVTEANGRSFWHNGAHDSHTRTWMCGVPGQDRAIVVMVNIDDPGGVTSTINPFFTEVISAYERSVGWSGTGGGV